MKTYLPILILVALIGFAPVVSAVSVNWDYTNNVLRPLSQFWTKEVQVPYITATSTATSTLPYLESTLFKITKLCLSGDTCRTTWPTGGGGGSISTSTAVSAGNLAAWTSNKTLGQVATGTLSETALGLEFSATRGLIGGASILSLTSGYQIPTTTRMATWDSAYTNIHNAVTLAGEDYLSLSTQQITANAIDPDNLSASDFGSFSCNGTNCTLDANSVNESMLNLNTNTAGYLLQASSTASGGFAWVSTSTLGITAATSLDGAYNGGSTITADSGAVEITVPDTSNNAGLVINQNDVTNFQSAIDINTSGSQDFSPIIEMYNSEVLAAGQYALLGQWRFYGEDSASNKDLFGQVFFQADDNTSGAEIGSITFQTREAGNVLTKLVVGAGDNGIGVGDGTAAGLITSRGNQDLILQTGNTTTGTITLADGANGNIILSPNGTGGVVIGTTTAYQTSKLTIGAGTTTLQAAPSGLIARMFENSGGDSFDFKIASDGDFSFVPTGSAASRLELDNVTDQVRIGNELAHIGDTNTYLRFSDDQISLTAGGVVFLNLVEAVTDIVTALGEWDFGGATSLEIPNGASPTVDVAGEIAIDTSSGQFRYYSATGERVLGNGNFYPAFTITATTTTFTGTTTYALGTAYIAETWNGVQCFTDTGTAKARFGDGTNWTNVASLSTTVGTVSLSSNNTFTAQEKRYVQIGTPASSPVTVSCSISKSITAD